MNRNSFFLSQKILIPKKYRFGFGFAFRKVMVVQSHFKACTGCIHPPGKSCVEVERGEVSVFRFNLLCPLQGNSFPIQKSDHKSIGKSF